MKFKKNVKITLLFINKTLICLTMCFAMRSSMPYNQSFFCKVDSNSQITLGNIPKKSWLMQFVLTSVAKSANFNYILLISINICDIFSLRFLLWTQTQKSLSNQKLLSQCHSRYFPDLCTSDDCLLTAHNLCTWWLTSACISVGD